jgi:hypothetical protein
MRTEPRKKLHPIPAFAHCTRMQKIHLFACATLLALTGVACGDDDDFATYEVVGLACGSNLDCAPGVDCEHGKEFGDGTCTLPCRDHFDCPQGASCVDPNGGVCLVSCLDDSWCRPGFHCKAKHNHSGPGDSYVCAK